MRTDFLRTSAAPNPAPAMLDALCRGEGIALLVVVAHPDDEVIGAGGQLLRWQPAAVVHVTDGAPRDLRDAQAAGFSQREAYAEARARELEAAMACAGLGPERLHKIGIVDQEASLNLVALTQTLADLFEQLAPEAVLTHPYEGGHPDHDATAFAVHSACKLMRQSGALPPALLEMTSYHHRHGRIASGRFLAHPGTVCKTLPLDEDQRAIKRRMLECFRTQSRVLENFRPGRARESFRTAPSYDFEQPPHGGQLLFEAFHWALGGMSGVSWRRLARAASAQLGFEPNR